MCEPIADALRALPPPSVSSLEARGARIRLEDLREEFRRLHALAIATPATPVTVTPVPSSPLSVEELAKKREELIEQRRIENEKEQGRSVEPSAYEPMRERAVPRSPEPETLKPISGGADWPDWVK